MFNNIDVRIKYVLAIYIVVFAIVTIFIFSIGDKFLSNFNFIENVFIGFVANLVFFGMFGLATFIPSIINPKDEPISRRLGFLITSDRVSNLALSHMRQEITLMCAYIEKSVIQISVKEIDQSSGYFLVDHRCTSTIRNTFKNEIYFDQNFEIMVHPDPAGKVILAEIDSAEFIIDGVISPIIKDEIPISDAKPFRTSAILRIPEDGTAQYRMSCWLWCDLSLPYYTTFLRYTEFCEVRIVNKTQQEIKIIKHGDSSDTSIAQDSSVEFSIRNLAPGGIDLFRFVILV